MAIKKKKIYPGYDYHALAPKKGKKSFIKAKYVILLIVFIISGLLIFHTKSRETIFTTIDQVVYGGERQPNEIRINALAKNKIKTDNFEITLLNKEITEEVTGDYDFFNHTADGVFLVLDIQYKNIANSSKTLFDHDLKLIKKDLIHDSSFLFGLDQIILSDTINPGIEKRTKLIFDIPEKTARSRNLILKYTP